MLAIATASLGTDGVLVLCATAVFLVLLVTERASFVALGLLLIVTLPLLGVIDASAAVAGFANKAVLTIAGLYVIGEGLTHTGAMEFFGRLLDRVSAGKEWRLVFVLCALAASMSAFLNDTAVVVVMIPVLLKLSARSGVPASRLMMPLAFASLLGGICTLVGTSTNLIVSGLAERLGAAPLTMFSVTPVGVPMALVGIAFLTLLSRRLLPDHQSLTVMMEKAPQRDFVTELSVGADSGLVGKRYAEPLTAGGATVLCYVRDEALQQRPFDDATVQARDVIVISGSLDAFTNLTGTAGLDWLHGVKVDPRAVELFEVALAPRSTLAGQRLARLGLHRDFGVTPMAVLRAGRHLHERIGQLVVHPGDVLLVSGDEASRQRLRQSQDFFMLAGEPRAAKLPAHALTAMLIAVGVIVLLTLQSVFSWKALPASSVALAGAMAMVGAGVLTTRRAFRAIDWPILVFLAGTLALGEAMRATGVASWCADHLLVVLQPLGAAAVASGFVLLGLGFNFLIAHSAVAVLFTPIAIAAAGQLAAAREFGVDSAETQALVRAMLLAVCYGGSMCFATPIAHQVNLMVCGPGGYRYRDFLKLGLPLSLVVWLVASVGIPLATGIR